MKRRIAPKFFRSLVFSGGTPGASDWRKKAQVKFVVPDKNKTYFSISPEIPVPFYRYPPHELDVFIKKLFARMLDGYNTCGVSKH